jgi:hypothetical protein
VAWLVRHHPELGDAAIARLIGTTKSTIAAVRDRTHWNSSNLKPRDPVLLGLCTQTDLNAAVARARKALGKPPEGDTPAAPVPETPAEPTTETKDRSMLGGFDIAAFMQKSGGSSGS